MRDEAAASWVVRPRPSPAARLRLLCFAYAGGGVSAYRGWPEALAPDVEVCLVRLPGRESRLREEPFRRFAAVMDALVPALAPELEPPFALFGHSLGALLGFELARALEEQGGPRPVRLLVSGCTPPHRRRREEPVSSLPDSEFQEHIRSMGGTPAEILDNPELMAIFLPLLRADFAVSETYCYRPGPPLGCPISAFGGGDDPRVPRDELSGWAELTTRGLSVSLFPGNHFFLHSARPKLLSAVAEELYADIAGGLA